jgi:hypothetical protein
MSSSARPGRRAPRAGHTPGRRRSSTDERIRGTLDGVLAGRTQWPQRREFRSAHLAGLEYALDRDRDRDRGMGAWAAEYGLQNPRPRNLLATRRPAAMRRRLTQAAEHPSVRTQNAGEPPMPRLGWPTWSGSLPPWFSFRCCSLPPRWRRLATPRPAGPVRPARPRRHPAGDEPLPRRGCVPLSLHARLSHKWRCSALALDGSLFGGRAWPGARPYSRLSV